MNKTSKKQKNYYNESIGCQKIIATENKKSFDLKFMKYNKYTKIKDIKKNSTKKNEFDFSNSLATNNEDIFKKKKVNSGISNTKIKFPKYYGYNIDHFNSSIFQNKNSVFIDKNCLKKRKIKIKNQKKFKKEVDFNFYDEIEDKTLKFIKDDSLQFFMDDLNSFKYNNESNIKKLQTNEAKTNALIDDECNDNLLVNDLNKVHTSDLIIGFNNNNYLLDVYNVKKTDDFNNILSKDNLVENFLNKSNKNFNFFNDDTYDFSKTKFQNTDNEIIGDKFLCLEKSFDSNVLGNQIFYFFDDEKFSNDLEQNQVNNEFLQSDLDLIKNKFKTHYNELNEKKKNNYDFTMNKLKTKDDIPLMSETRLLELNFNNSENEKKKNIRLLKKQKDYVSIFDVSLGFNVESDNSYFFDYYLDSSDDCFSSDSEIDDTVDVVDVNDNFSDENNFKSTNFKKSNCVKFASNMMYYKTPIIDLNERADLEMFYNDDKNFFTDDSTDLEVTVEKKKKNIVRNHKLAKDILPSKTIDCKLPILGSWFVVENKSFNIIDGLSPLTLSHSSVTNIKKNNVNCLETISNQKLNEFNDLSMKIDELLCMSDY